MRLRRLSHCWDRTVILLIQQYSLKISSLRAYMDDRWRQSGDSRSGGCSVSFPFLFLRQTNGSQIAPSKHPHLCKLMAATRCNIHWFNGLHSNSRLSWDFSCGTRQENIIGRLGGCMMLISYFSDCTWELSVKFCIKKSCHSNNPINFESFKEAESNELLVFTCRSVSSNPFN